MARPTDYSEEKLKIAQDYFNYCNTNKKIPYLERLAINLDITRETLYQWSKDKENKPEFSYTIKRLEDLQRLALLEMSIKKDSFTPGQIFQLKANHGMIETEKRILAGDKDAPLGVVVLPPLKEE